MVHGTATRRLGQHEVRAGGGGSIDFVVPVLRSDHDAVVANVITLMADDENLRGIDTAEALGQDYRLEDTAIVVTSHQF